jgi:hypothetical protein
VFLLNTEKIPIVGRLKTTVEVIPFLLKVIKDMGLLQRRVTEGIRAITPTIIMIITFRVLIASEVPLDITVVMARHLGEITSDLV